VRKRSIILLLIISNLILVRPLSLADDSHYKTALELISLTYNKETTYQSFISFGLLPVKERFENNPKTKGYIDVLLNVTKEVLDAYFNDSDTQNNLKTIYAKIYTEEFTENELKELIKFYKTATGRKVLQKLATINQKAWERGMVLGSNMPAKYEQMITDRFRLLQEQGILPAKFGVETDLCSEYVDKKQYGLAIKACTEKIINGKPGAVDYYNRGTAYLNSGEHTRAIEDFGNSIRLAPDSFAAYSNRGSAYAVLGEIQKAIADFNKAVELNPYSSAPYYYRGNAYKSIGNTEQALADFNKAVDLGDKDPLAYYNRGGYYSEAGDYEQAIDDYSNALKIDNEFEYAYGNRGLAYGKMGKYEKAIEDFNIAIKLNPKRADNYYNRRIAFNKMGKRTDAFKDYKTSAKLGYEPAQDFLKTQGIEW